MHHVTTRHDIVHSCVSCHDVTSCACVADDEEAV